MPMVLARNLLSIDVDGCNVAFGDVILNVLSPVN